MQCRRRWSAIAVVMLIGATAGAAQARNPADDAKTMMVAKGSEAVSLRSAVITDITKMNPRDRDEYVIKMVGNEKQPGPFIALLTQDSNPEAQLNAAITIAMTKTLSADATLENVMLKSSNAAIRYWAAKGLDNIVGDLAKVGPAAVNRATAALNSAMSTETSGVVKQEIVRALGTAGDVGALETAAEAIANQLQSGTADHETVDAAGTALNEIDAQIKKGAKVDKAKVAKAAARIASFSSQQLLSMKQSLPEGVDVPESFLLSVRSAVSSALGLLNNVVGKAAFQPVAKSATPEEIQFAVDGDVGSASSPGQLQKLMPDVPAPPAIKKQ